ncbi:hypothetical protein FRC01_014511, partial [Tulasnella sp. 417]
ESAAELRRSQRRQLGMCNRFGAVENFAFDKRHCSIHEDAHNTSSGSVLQCCTRRGGIPTGDLQAKREEASEVECRYGEVRSGRSKICEPLGIASDSPYERSSYTFLLSDPPLEQSITELNRRDVSRLPPGQTLREKKSPDLHLRHSTGRTRSWNEQDGLQWQPDEQALLFEPRTHKSAEKAAHDTQFQLQESEGRRARQEDKLLKAEVCVENMKQQLAGSQTSEGTLQLQKCGVEREAADYKRCAL